MRSFFVKRSAAVPDPAAWRSPKTQRAAYAARSRQRNSPDPWGSADLMVQVQDHVMRVIDLGAILEDPIGQAIDLHTALGQVRRGDTGLQQAQIGHDIQVGITPIPENDDL